MPLFDFIANLKSRRRFSELNQDQNEALLDCLTAAKAIDGELTDAEHRELLEVMGTLEWSGARSMTAYVDLAVKRAQQLPVEAAALQAFFEDIGARLEEDWLRQEAYYLASRVVLADRKVEEEERIFLKHLVAAFGIPSKVQQKVIRKAHDDMGME